MLVDQIAELEEIAVEKKHPHGLEPEQF